MNAEIVPFRHEVADGAIADLRRRLNETRWPDQIAGSGWDYGTDGAYLKTLCSHWADAFNWREHERRFNRHTHYRTHIQGRQMHFYHVRSLEPQAQPLLLSHGWPGSVAEFLDVMGPLTNPRAYGGDAADAFHVVAPSLPGYGFSDAPTTPGYRAGDMAEAFAELMQCLGFDRYFAHGGDKGTRITMELAALYPERVTAIHLGLMPAAAPDPADREAGLDAHDIDGVRRTQAFINIEMAYQALQRTKPQTLSYGLMDSPAGLAAWLVEKFRAWSDCKGGIDRHFNRDRLLDNISLYWLTGTIGSSIRSYYEDGGPGRERPLPQVRVPVGHTVFPAEIMYTPRAWAQRSFDIRYWNEAPAGGHFPAMELPDLFTQELRACFRQFR